MSQPNQDEIIRRQEKEIEKLQKQNREMLENQQAQMRQIEGIKKQAEKDREAQETEKRRQEWERQRQEAERIEKERHESGAISYLQDQRCATCEYFDCSRHIDGEPPIRPELKATSGFCKANTDRTGEISPAACCTKWEKWAEIEQFEMLYKQKEKKNEDERIAKEEFERQQKENADRFNFATKDYQKKVHKYKVLLIIPIVVAIVAVAISGIVYATKLIARNFAENAMNAWTELGHSLTDTYGMEFVQKYNSACENASSSFSGFIVTLGIALAVIIVAIVFWISKRKQIIEEKPQKHDFGL
ncbi:MAG: hypothetical protein MJ210_05805 [Alphaproteobacteria bacterium]|nr:hypothetical protein [Alphaproteobacteria bacterium]